MKNIRIILFGVAFSFVLIKTEAVSWFRIQEMFHFHSIHMYGVLFSAILTTFLGLRLLPVFKSMDLKTKELQVWANVLGGICFGIGWAITGACTGPLYILLGMNILPAIIVFLGTLIGVFLYALLKKRLPHNWK